MNQKIRMDGNGKSTIITIVMKLNTMKMTL